MSVYYHDSVTQAHSGTQGFSMQANKRASVSGSLCSDDRNEHPAKLINDELLTIVLRYAGPS